VGRRGPAPKPAGLRLVEGTDRRGRSGRRLDRAREPVVPVGELEPPYVMSEAALNVWKQTVADLEAMGVASPADRHQIAAYVEAVVLHERATSLVRDSSIVVQGAHGLVVDKAVIVQRQAANTMRLLAQEFGLSPSARTRVEALPRDSENNPFA
jgi:P27 family predicted phage terminase small subunit